MKIRNAKKITETSFNCEIEHPEYGWIPYTAVEGEQDDMMIEVVGKIKKLKNLKYDAEAIKISTRFRAEDLVSDIERSKLSEYSEGERALFGDKYNEANKVLNGERSSLLEIEADLRGDTVEELAAKIIDKDAAYKKALVQTSGLRKMVERAFDEAGDDIDAIRQAEEKIKEAVAKAKS